MVVVAAFRHNPDSFSSRPHAESRDIERRAVDLREERFPGARYLHWIVVPLSLDEQAGSLVFHSTIHDTVRDR